MSTVPNRTRPGVLYALAAAALSLTLTAPTVAAQAIVVGTVIEDGTDQPIVNVDLRLIGRGGEVEATALSDANGGFRLEAPDGGMFTLRIRRIGYAGVTADSLAVADGERIQIEVLLNPEAVALEAVRVIAERPVAFWLAEVRRRTELNRRMGVGRIYLREDIERMQLHSVSDLLNRVGYATRCQPTVLLDGLETEARYIPHAPDMIEAVEIYRGGTQVPLEYHRYSACGVTLVWTRPDPPNAKPLTWRRVIAAGLLVGVAALLVQ